MAKIPGLAIATVLSALGAGVLAKAASGKKPSTTTRRDAPPGAVQPGMPAVLAERIARAILTQDPVELERVATEVERAGYGAEAQRLRVLAAELRRQRTGEPLPDVSIMPVPDLPTRQPGDASLALRTRAATALMEHLRGTRRYKEDRAKVKAFQALMGLKDDGLYGAKTALAAASVGVIPVKPFYWSKTSAKADQSSYRKRLTEYAAADPARSGQWLEAAQV